MSQTVAFEIEGADSLGSTFEIKLSRKGFRRRPVSRFLQKKILTVVERDFRPSRRGRPSGPRLNSNCPEKASDGRPSLASYKKKILTVVERDHRPSRRADHRVLVRTRTVQRRLPTAARLSLPTKKSLRASSGIIGLLEGADHRVRFRTRTFQKRLPTAARFSRFLQKILTVVERDFRPSKKGRPLGPLLNSNCPDLALPTKFYGR